MNEGSVLILTYKEHLTIFPSVENITHPLLLSGYKNKIKFKLKIFNHHTAWLEFMKNEK